MGSGGGRAMKLEDLVASCTSDRALALRGSGALEVSGLAYDSRSVGGGELFFCVTGLREDGHDHAEQAVRAGACALVVERPLALGVPEVLVTSARAAMAPIAARFFGEPSRELTVVGVTGTNGKTTTAYLSRALLEAGGSPPGGPTGLLGTVKSVIGGHDRTVQRTTPEAIDLQADLRAMLDAGDRACAMEVSSHALTLGRVAAIEFAAAIFTNLTQDHLDFHATMEDYFQAKRSLFLPSLGEPPRMSVINVGDTYGRRLAGELPNAVTFAVGGPADYSALRVRCALERCRFELHTPDGAHELELAMPGSFNVANALGALAAVHALGGDLERLLDALARGVRVPGRFEPVEEGQDFAVLVDYAHTPDSLENVLRAARELVARSGRVICVFGAGGDRDTGKRPLMGEIAARLADVVLVTSDNPRSEDPELIIAQIMQGTEGVARGRNDTITAGARGEQLIDAVSDRRAAIMRAVAQARHGDVVIIAGKGHEQGQEFANARRVPFDDMTVAREALRALDRSPLQEARSA